ncbi:hypothetical protein B4168_1268 [Anoxybacillus flavithermus]|nr:hypothetical protein GT20_1269 [Parageobacillus thermoglucosidasius TNO-09.020]KYD18511.1 hypothetical protein B4168_1268 [Anoxybacillus flavithermus]OAO88584.1 hypothetical protein GT23_0240 [Parageobacillus thermoglucosidasius]
MEARCDDMAHKRKMARKKDVDNDTLCIYSPNSKLPLVYVQKRRMVKKEYVMNCRKF